MPDFTLDPDALEGDRSHGPPPRPLVSTGLAATAAVPPRARKTPETPSAYAPCPACGLQVLTGATPAGERVALDTQVKTYVPRWLEQTPRPILHASRGYPVHRCGALGAPTPVTSMEVHI